MADVDFDLKGLDKFGDSLLKLCDVYLDTAEKHLKKAGNKLKSTAKNNTPDSGFDHKKKLKDSWRGEIQGYGANDLEYQLRNTAPHYHLVERGHKQVGRDGKTKGFVQGKFFLEQSVQEFNSSGEMEKEIEKLASELADKVGR